MTRKPNPLTEHDTAPFDEVGTPSEYIERCGKHDVLYRKWGKCLECEREGEA